MKWVHSLTSKRRGGETLEDSSSNKPGSSGALQREPSRAVKILVSCTSVKACYKSAGVTREGNPRRTASLMSTEIESFTKK